jgi:hypothetical protein
LQREWRCLHSAACETPVGVVLLVAVLVRGVQSMPKWLKPLAVVVAGLLPAILIAGIVSVPYRATLPPEGADQPRVHWNTKNTTRFAGADLLSVATLVTRRCTPRPRTPAGPISPCCMRPTTGPRACRPPVCCDR